MEYILVAIVICLIPAAIAQSKGKNFVAWWLYGAALFIVALPTEAQPLGTPTWNGLRFGMSEQETKLVLKSGAVRPSDSEKSTDARMFTGWVVRDVEIHQLSGNGTLFFDAKTRRLVQVLIAVNPPSDMSPYAVELRLKGLREDLIKKYGNPLLEPECLSSTCNVIWKDQGQTIELTVFKTTHFTILDYKPVNAKSDI